MQRWHLAGCSALLSRTCERRERADGMFQPITYLCAKLTQELTLAVASSLVFTCIIFWALELPGSFGLFFLTYYQTTCIGIGPPPPGAGLCCRGGGCGTHLSSPGQGSVHGLLHARTLRLTPCAAAPNPLHPGRPCLPSIRPMQRHTLHPRLCTLNARARAAVLAYFIAAVSPTLEVANSALPAYVVSLLFFVGLLIRYEDMPDYWSWCGGSHCRCQGSLRDGQPSRLGLVWLSITSG